MPILEATNITQKFRSGDRKLTVLDQINFKITAGTTCSIVGPSGSGKTTPLGLCAGLDRPEQGEVELNCIALDPLSEDERARVRNKYVGFVFQTFQLVATLTALENVMVPMELRGQGTKVVRRDAAALLTGVGLKGRLNHYPAQLRSEERRVGKES